MTYLLDTNVISQFIAKRPAQQVLRWVQQHRASNLYLSSITIGEIQQGISLLPNSRRKNELSKWLHDRLLVEYDAYILPTDRQTMLLWGDLSASQRKLGHPMPIMDSLIAATAIQHGLSLVTRNSADFQHLDLNLVNPWDK